MSELMDRFSGRAKELAGKATGNKKLEFRGKLQHDLAHIKEEARDVASHLS